MCVCAVCVCVCVCVRARCVLVIDQCNQTRMVTIADTCRSFFGLCSFAARLLRGLPCRHPRTCTDSLGSLCTAGRPMAATIIRTFERAMRAGPPRSRGFSLTTLTYDNCCCCCCCVVLRVSFLCFVCTTSKLSVHGLFPTPLPIVYILCSFVSRALCPAFLTLSCMLSWMVIGDCCRVRRREFDGVFVVWR